MRRRRRRKRWKEGLLIEESLISWGHRREERKEEQVNTQHSLHRSTVEVLLRLLVKTMQNTECRMESAIKLINP